MLPSPSADDHRHPHPPGHGHGGGAHRHGVSRETQQRALWIALVANAGFLGAEVAGGLIFRSLALLADAAHMFSDVVGLSIALIAQRLITRPATARHSYGFQRSEVLGGQFNALTLLAVAGWVVYEAIHRIGTPVDTRGAGMLVVATLGLLVNIGSAAVLARARDRSLNMKGAFLHMAVDAVGSLAAMVAAVAVIAWRAEWADPVVSILVSGLVIWSAWSLLRDTTHVMLEGAPGDIDVAAVEAALSEDPRVLAVHHTHLWSLASDVTAFSGHVVLAEGTSLHDAQLEGARLKTLLAERFRIDHATLELECHDCSPTAAEADHR